MISSFPFNENYAPVIKNYESHLNRALPR